MTRRRLRGAPGERGAIAVAAALMMPILLIAAGLAVDTTASWLARNQVVTGADAAALAQAMECAEGNCGTDAQIKARASHYFIDNNTGSKQVTLQPGTGWIQYDTGQRAARSQGTWDIRHLFGAALGVRSTQLTVESMARWSGLPSAEAELPVAISYCAFVRGARAGTATVTLQDDTSGDACRTPAGTDVTGTSALTAATGSACGTTSAAAATVASATTVPAACSASYLDRLVGKEIVVAVYDQTAADQTRVYGYAALRVSSVSAASPPSVTGSFTYLGRQINTPSSAPTAPDLGARAVFLWDPDTWQGRRCPC